MNGLVKSFYERKGFGYIQPLVGTPDLSPDIWFHASALRLTGPGRLSVPVGAEVTFTVVRGTHGLQAANIHLVPVKIPRAVKDDSSSGKAKTQCTREL